MNSNVIVRRRAALEEVRRVAEIDIPPDDAGAHLRQRHTVVDLVFELVGEADASDRLFTSAEPPKFHPTNGVMSQSADALRGAAVSAIAHAAAVTSSFFTMSCTPRVSARHGAFDMSPHCPRGGSASDMPRLKRRRSRPALSSSHARRTWDSRVRRCPIARRNANRPSSLVWDRKTSPDRFTASRIRICCSSFASPQAEADDAERHRRDALEPSASRPPTRRTAAPGACVRRSRARIPSAPKCAAPSRASATRNRRPS